MQNGGYSYVPLRDRGMIQNWRPSLHAMSRTARAPHDPTRTAGCSHIMQLTFCAVALKLKETRAPAVRVETAGQLNIPKRDPICGELKDEESMRISSV